MKNKSKGFTLVELIGVIVIIALLALLITPVISNTLKSSKNKLYSNTLNNIELSAKDWFTDEDNITKLPTNVNECYITLTELKNEGVVDLDIKNPKTGEPLDDSKINVLVSKVGSSYEFTVVDDASTLGGQCTDYTPNVLAPTINATTFNDYRKSFALNITYDNLSSTSGQTFQYYLSSSSNSLKNGAWTNYTNGVSQTIGSDKTGTYYVFVKRLSNVIDGQTNTSTMGGVLVKIGNETYHRFGPYRFDNNKPTWTFYQKTNDNDSMNSELENINYAYQEHTVTITFRGTDENYQSSSLSLNNIIIKIGNADVSSSVTKELSAVKNMSNGVEYTLKLKNMTQSGKLSIVIPANTITDKAGNTNNETTINSEIKVNMCNYPVNKTWTYDTAERHTLKVPCTGTYEVEVYGAQGGGNTGAGGKGAKITGRVRFNRNTNLNIYVGGQGTTNQGGYNGGGNGTYGGGGASDIRVGGTAYANRIITAGGGGGGSNFGVAGGAGGAVNGVQAGSVGRDSCDYCIYGEQGKMAKEMSCSYTSDFSPSNSKTCVARYAQGGTQTAGGEYGATVHFNEYVGGWTGYSGKIGEGGDGMAAAGGGGGFYGGAGGAAEVFELLSGAGGSSCVSTNESSDYSNCKNNSYLFTNVNATTGAQSGNGKVVIKFISD